VPLGEWVIATACAQARQWQDSSPELAGLPIAVNIAIPQLNYELPAVISRELARHDIAASCLQLEITESLLIRDLQKTTSVLKDISASGITIAIDDVGTGYSSPCALNLLPFDILKLDQSSIRNLAQYPNDSAV